MIFRGRPRTQPQSRPTGVADVPRHPALLEPLFPVGRGIRLLGVTLSSLGTGGEPQLHLPI